MKDPGLHLALRAVFAEGGSSRADRWRLLASCLFGFSLPLAPPILPLLMAVVVATRLIDRDVRVHRPLFRVDPKDPLIWAVVLFLLHIIGMAWTSNAAFGWFDVGIKLPLLLLPLLGLLPGAGNKGRDAVLLSFCAGNVVAVVVCIVLATLRALSADGLGVQEFISSAFSAILHPSYFAWYLTTALACFHLGGLQGRLPRAVGLAAVVVLCLGIVLAGSRLGWIALPVVLLWALVHGWHNRWTRTVLLAVLTISLCSGVALTVVSEHVRYRVFELFTATDKGTPDPFSSAAIRSVTWKAGWEVGRSNMPWGTGTGDVKDELLLRYEETGAMHARERELNAHNQFIQSFAALGIPGGLALALMCVIPLITALGQRGSGVLRACALLLLILNCSVESMLEVQAGTLFTGWMLWTLWWPAGPVASSQP